MMLLNNHGFRMEPKISVAGWDSVILQNDWLRDFWNEGLQKQLFCWKILASPFSEPPLFFHLPAGLCRKDWVLCKGMVWRDLPLVAATVVSLMGRSGTTAFATQSFWALWHTVATGWRWSIYDLIAPQFHSDPFFQKYRIWGPLTCNYDTENWCYRVGFDSQGMMTETEYCYTRESRFPQPSFFFVV